RPPTAFPAGSPAAIADAYLRAVADGDAAAAYALMNPAVMALDEEEFEEMLSSELTEIGGISRYRVLGQETGRSDAGEVAVVWTLIATGSMGDLALDVYLERQEGAETWRVTTTSGGRAAEGGPLVPPGIETGGQPLKTVADRPRPLHAYDDSMLEAVLGGNTAGDVRVVVSPKTELAFVVAGLTGVAPEFCGSRSVLGPDALRHFRDYRGHEAVEAMAFLHQRGLSYDAVAKFASCFSDPPALEQIFPFGDYLCSRTYGIDRTAREARLLDLARRMREFYRDADFGSYLDSRRRYYDDLVAEIERALTPGIPRALESYFGTGHSAYLVVVSAFSGNYGNILEDGDWTCAVAVISGTMAKRLSGGELSSALWSLTVHEWSHTLVRHAFDAHEELIASYSHLYRPIARAMSELAYSSWRCALEEHVIRAVEARLALLYKGPDEAERILSRHESQGFRYIRVLYDRLADYEADRETYPRFEDFLPDLLSALDGA
ncbi:MAG TPA: hypothetical protein DGR79_05540, partial [Clostridiales bacterium]|nr:hypothetical protein [Clostridiales bacterium]